MNYRLVVRRGYYEWHFLFKKIQEAGDFVAEWKAHNVPCGDRDDDAAKVTFTINIEDENKGD